MPGKVTQEQLSELMGVGRNTVSRYESLPESATVRPGTIKLWALATGYDFEWLMTGIVPDHDGGDDVSSTNWYTEKASVTRLPIVQIQVAA